MKVQSFRNVTTSLASAAIFLLAPCLWAQGGQLSSPVIGYEAIGQVLNPSAQQSLQYGYLNLAPGVERITTSPELAVSESTALLTFFNDTTTERVINNGPIRVVDRVGKGAIYFTAGNATFANPDSFRNGLPVQGYTVRHQVVIDTATGYFTTLFEIKITSVQNFQIDDKTYRLGRPGRVYRLNVAGKLSSGVPSAFIAGVADGGGGVADND